MGHLSVTVSQEQRSCMIRSLFSAADRLAISSCKVGSIPQRAAFQLSKLSLFLFWRRRPPFLKRCTPTKAFCRWRGTEADCRRGGPRAFPWLWWQLRAWHEHERLKVRTEVTHEALACRLPVGLSPSSPLHNLEQALRFIFLVA